MEKQLNKKVPAIRFKGFEDEWIRAPVGAYYDFKNGLNKGKEYFGFGTPIVNFTDVYKNRSLVFDDLKGKVSLTVDEISNFNVKKGDVFFTRTSETIEEIGYPSVMENEPVNTVFSGFVLRARAKDVDPLAITFKRYSFFTKSFRSEMMMKSSMTTRALTSGSAIKKMYFCFPGSKKEQSGIGGYFKTLDIALSLHQCEHNKLVTLKQAMLQKMFPQKDAATPEVRFKGFEGEWVIKNLGDLGCFYRGLSYNAHNVCNEGLLVLRSSNIQNSVLITDNNLQFVNLNCPSELMLRVGDIAICMSNGSKSLVGKSAICHLEPELPATVGAFCSIYRSSSHIAPYLLQTSTYWKYLSELLAGSSINNLRNSDLYKLMFRVPVEIEEQQKIGNYFQKLDQLISQHATQLEKLKQIKAACLERMFV